MTLDILGDLNWLAVVVGAAIYFALGAIWFMPAVLGRPWMRAIGIDPDQPQQAPGIAYYLAPAVFYLFGAVATAMLAVATGSDDIGEGVLLGLVVGIGYALMITAVDAAFDPNKPKPWVWFAISGAYHLVGLVIVAVLVSVWR
jgi:hypothetical protein